MIRISAFADEISQDPAEQIEVLARHRIRHIEFRAILGKNVLDLSDSEHAAFRVQLQEHGFGLSAIGSPIGKIKIDDDFDAHLARFDRALELADFYQTPRIRVFSFYLPPEDEPESHRAAVMARMTELAHRAHGRGIVLYLENEKGIYGDNAARVKDILDTVASPALVHAFDPANYLEVGQPVEAAWALLRPYVRHFHVKDLDLSTHRNVPAGTGDGRIPELIADLAQAGYDGFCTLEPHLVVAEKSFGFTGPERFGDAARALQGALDARGIAWC